MDHLALNKGLQFQIMIPCFFLFYKIIDFQYTYFKNMYKKKVIVAGIVVSILSLPILFLLNFEPYFIFVWFVLFLIGPSAMNAFVKLSINELDYRDVNFFSYVTFVLSWCAGLFVIILPYLSLFELTGGTPGDYRIKWISRAIYFTLGLSLILLNRVTLNRIWRYKNGYKGKR